MAAVIRALYKSNQDLMISSADPRTENFALSQSILIPIGIIVVYVLFVKKWLPEFMKNRPAYNIKALLIAYNLVQIVLSARVFYVTARYAYIFGPYKFRCQPVDYSDSWLGLLFAHETHRFYLLKIFDLLDTVFFVLRKKQKQVTFLHLYHHGVMVLAGWIAVRFIAGGHVVFVGFINSFVHVVMYSYYLLAVYNNSAPIWWKKYLTLLQIFQFGIFALQWAIMLLGPHCGFPKQIGFLFLPQNVFITVLFVDFYYIAYIKNK